LFYKLLEGRGSLQPWSIRQGDEALKCREERPIYNKEVWAASRAWDDGEPELVKSGSILNQKSIRDLHEGQECDPGS
jgi:hypothetical protein